MDDSRDIDLHGEPQDSLPQQETEPIGRRDFLKLAAILTGSTLLLLSRCSGLDLSEPLPDEGLPPIPPNFKRFLLVKREQRLNEVVEVVVAFGSQCPDWSCALLWVDRPEFEFYGSVEEILNQYTSDRQTELVWLD